MIKRFLGFMGLCFSLFIPGVSPILGQKPKAPERNKIRIAVLCINTTTGKNHWLGIKEALGKVEYINLESHYYSNSSDGFEQMKNLIDQPEPGVDIILGPTESDIFVQAVSVEEELSKNKIPVISGLVTANVGNRSDGWFFRTNVDVSHRVQIIFDFLNKFWIGKMAVIYADTEFGRRAERAFRGELKTIEKESRLSSLLYSDPPHPRKQLAIIFKNRPEAVGLFCEREDIETIYQQFKTMNNSIAPYNPVFFTILDINRLADSVDDFYFVSLVRKEYLNQEYKSLGDVEVKALGYDLGLLVIKVLNDINYKKKLSTNKFDEESRLEFRKQLVTHMMNRNLKESKTEMKFNDLENVTKLRVYHLKNKKVIAKPIPEFIGPFKKIYYRFNLIFSVYGVFVLTVILIVILIIAFSINRMEIKRVFPEKHVKIFKTATTYLYIGTHVFIVLALYIFLCESGRIRYNDILMAIIISLTPTAMLKTTFFETKYGRTMGLEDIYKGWMEKIELKIMESRYVRLEALTNVIAYSNSLNSIRNSLHQIFRQHPSPAQRAKLIQKMEDDIEREPDYLKKRKVGARFLIRQFDRERLKAEGFVPNDWDYENSHDPRLIVRQVAKHCRKDPKKINTIKKALNKVLKTLKRRNPERYAEIVDFIEKEKKETISIEGELIVTVRNLFVIRGFDTDWLVKNKFLNTESLDFLNQNLSKREKRFMSRTKTIIRSFWSKF